MIKSKTLMEYYTNRPDEYTLKYHHYNIIVDNESREEYSLLEKDIKYLRSYNKNNSIIYFSDLDNLNKVLINTSVFHYLDDIYLRIRNKEEYNRFKELDININLVIELKDLDNINPNNNKVIIQIDTIKELDIDEINTLKNKYNITSIIVGQIAYFTNEYINILNIISKQFNIDKSNQLELEKNNELTNDIYDLNTYMNIINEINKIIEINKKNNDIETVKNIFYYLARNINYDNDGVIKTNIESQNLIGPLFKKKAVCEGYSKLFNQILSLLSIESIIVSGGGRKENGGHVWNQVKIGDKWHNADITTQSFLIHNNKQNNMFLVKDELCKYVSSSPFAKKCDNNYKL